MSRILRLVVGLFLLGSLAGCDFTPGFEEFNAPPAPSEDSDELSCGGEGILCTVAGMPGVPGIDGNDGPAEQSLLSHPVDVTMAPLTMEQTGEVFILDFSNDCVRRVGPDGLITRFIGTGQQGDTAGGPADRIELNHPTGLVVGPDGNLFVAAWLNAKIKRVDVLTLATTAPYGGDPGFGGDGGPAAQARFNLPSSLAFDPDGNLFVSDQGNQRIRKIDPSGLVSTLAGSVTGYADGPSAQALFHFPDGPAPLPGGRISMNTHDWVLYIADTENNRIRRYNFFTGEVTTVAGTGEPGYAGDGGNAHTARLNRPTDVIFTEDHRVYIADTGNHAIRKIDAFGTMTTLVGTGEAGISPDGTPASLAQLNRPMGIFFDEVTRTLYIADTDNHQVRRIYDPY